MLFNLNIRWQHNIVFNSSTAWIYIYSARLRTSHIEVAQANILLPTIMDMFTFLSVMRFLQFRVIFVL